MGYFDNKAGSLIEAATSVKNKTIETEGNKFTKALTAARENGDKVFSVNGKQYRTEDLDKLDVDKIKDVIKQLKGAVKAHTGQHTTLQKALDDDNTNDKSDDGDGLDKVQPKATKKKFDDRKDKDIDNDGDVDSSDKYLHKRRKAISKAIKKDEQKMNEYVTSNGAKKRVAEGDKRLKANQEQKEENLLDIQQKKNYSMREAMAKIWGVEEGYNYFAQNTSGVSNELDEGKMKQVAMQIDDIARAMSKDKNMKSFVSAFKKDATKTMDARKSLEKVLPDYVPGKDIAKLLNMGEVAEKTTSGQKETKVLINPKV